MGSNAKVFSKSWSILESYLHNTVLAAVLSFWAGNFNSLSSIAILFERASHVSGRIADIGIDLVLMPIGAFFMVAIWISFVLGSYLAGLLLPKLGLTRSLILQSVYVFVAALVVAAGVSAEASSDYGIGKAIMAFILPLSMGFQNSITTQLPLERTTHWTGASTDLGIALSKGSYPLAVFICVKILSFIIGAAFMAYLIGVAGIAPHRGLLFISAGLIITTIVGDKINKKHSSK
jgi:uncharacterized membrane protein YoaK (UPF0700 family)